MKFRPPLQERSKEDLFRILLEQEEWNPEAILETRKEIELRGIGDDEIQAWMRQEKQIQHRLAQIGKIKADASYKLYQIVLIILFSPFLFAFISHAPGEDFVKKRKQWFLFVIVGIILWIIAIKSFG